MKLINYFFVEFISLIVLSSSAFAQGILRGKITDSEEGLSLAGARISLIDTEWGAVSNKNGEFTILRVPTGSYQIKVNYIGYQEYIQTVSVYEGQTSFFEIALNPTAIVTGGVVVIGEQVKGQAKALNQQKTNINITNIVSSDQVGRFPDANIGDAMKRITGITVQYDQGEARFGLIRGTASSLNSITINGDRIPSAEGDNRTIQLDLIPSDMIQAIELNKAVTADMDADAIGGSINLVTKNIPNRTRVSATLGGGYNLLSEKPILNGSFTTGTRFMDNKLGVSISGAYNNHHLGSDNVEAEWLEGPNGTTYLGDFQIRQYDVIRLRQSIGGGMDYKFNNNHSIAFNALYNHRNDWENRYALRLRYDKGDAIEVDGEEYDGLPDANGIVNNVELIRENKQGINNSDNNSMRLEKQKTMNFAFAGEHLFGSNIKMNWQGNWAKASEEKPNERNIAYSDEEGVVAPNISNMKEPLFNIQTGTDLSKFSLSELTQENGYTDDIDFNGRMDFELPLMEGEYKNRMKFGARYRGKDKTRKNDFFEYDPLNDDLKYMSQTELDDISKDNFLAGDYTAGQFVNKDFAGSLDLDNPDLFEKFDLKEEYIADNYTASEKITAGYLQIEQQLGRNFLILAGLRLENTQVDYNANELEFDEDNEDNPYKITPTEGSQNYMDVLPQVHFKYSFSPDFILRAAFTNTLARPNYYDLAPYRSIAIADNELSEGNSSLKPTKSMNLDLMADYYFQAIGVISAGVFYKDITDYFYTNVVRDYDDPKSDNTFDYYFRPENGASATLFGFEFAFQRQLDFLPGFLKGLGIYANYTYTTSEAEGLNIEGREDEKTALPGTANNMLNASLSYEWGPINMRLSLNYTTDYVDEFGESDFFDAYYDSQTFLDFNASYEIMKGFYVFAEANNITNQPLRYYQGKGFKDRVMQAEYYNMRLNFGLKYNF